MNNIIYSVILAQDQTEGTQTKLVLTEEVNRLVVWRIDLVGEDEDFSVVETFGDYQRNEAIEFAVRFKDKKEETNNDAIVQRVLRHLNAANWTPDTLDRIADELRQGGYTILDWPSGSGEEEEPT